MGAPAQSRSHPIHILVQIADPPLVRGARRHIAVSGPALGLVLALLTGIGLLVLLVGLAALAGSGGRATILVLGSGQATAALLLQALADLIVLGGGWRMWQADQGGRAIVVVGLLVALLGSLVGGGEVGAIVVLVLLYALVVLSRFPEAIPAPGMAGVALPTRGPDTAGDDPR